jgi:hypothetical protein
LAFQLAPRCARHPPVALALSSVRSRAQRIPPRTCNFAVPPSSRSAALPRNFCSDGNPRCRLAFSLVSPVCPSGDGGLGGSSAAKPRLALGRTRRCLLAPRMPPLPAEVVLCPRAKSFP